MIIRPCSHDPPGAPAPCADSDIRQVVGVCSPRLVCGDAVDDDGLVVLEDRGDADQACAAG